MWKLAEQLGAVCAADVDATVTHVRRAGSFDGEGAVGAGNNKFLVNPNWIKAAGFRWCRPNEQEYTGYGECHGLLDADFSFPCIFQGPNVL
ncbi:hypothetical protein PR202_gb10071 [Eleusine coracana subsp. coracana]|uniref:Uncharacterized protein n=1 Tax=Eleusine coracana subsp. coracana TaxID=191504 RepID=A0AAV5EIY4_ELECO|nr:hypothetical protein PR202_gb10071 [Eleusine coracana subsp. coracana]